jgi:hypothetical protein
VADFVEHYHQERNHQDLANRLIGPEASHLAKAGVVQWRQRLGDMLNYYYRAAAWIGERSSVVDARPWRTY